MIAMGASTRFPHRAATVVLLGRQEREYVAKEHVLVAMPSGRVVSERCVRAQSRATQKTTIVMGVSMKVVAVSTERHVLVGQTLVYVVQGHRPVEGGSGEAVSVRSSPRQRSVKVASMKIVTGRSMKVAAVSTERPVHVGKTQVNVRQARRRVRGGSGEAASVRSSQQRRSVMVKMTTAMERSMRRILAKDSCVIRLLRHLVGPKRSTSVNKVSNAVVCPM